MPRSAAANPIEKLAERGMALLNGGDFAGAEKAFAKIAAKLPRHAATQHYLAMAQLQMGDYQKAVRSAQKAVKFQPADADAYNTLGVALRLGGDILKALEAFRTAVKFGPDNPRNLLNLAESLHDVQRADEALVHAEKLVGLTPDDPVARHRLGTTLRAGGEMAAAGLALRRAVALDPANGAAWIELGMMGALTPDDLVQLTGLLAGLDGNPSEAAKICFALFRGHDRLNQTAEAGPYLARANHLKQQSLGYDIAADEANLAAIATTFDADFIAHRRGASEAGEGLIFVLGLPRSGTSLIEQILASHSRAFGIGEIDLVRLTLALDEGVRAQGFPKQCRSWKRRDWQRLGGAIGEQLFSAAGASPVVIDKTLLNFRHIGFLRLALPQAKIIHCRRSPMDCGYSIFQQLFSDQYGFCYDLTDLGRYFRAYEQLMDHWRRVLPDEFLEVDYEHIVEAQERETRRMLDYCDLPWEDACLDFHRTKRAVRTASANQVRQPIYKTSIEAWRRYEDLMQPLAAAL